MIEVNFYTLRPEVVKSIAKYGMSKTESKLFYYLLQLDPFGDRPIRSKTAEILLATGIGKTAYHQAVAKFEALGWFDFKHTDVYITNTSCVRKSEKAVQKSVKTEKRFGKTDYQSAKTESRDPESAQGAEPFSPHTDLIPIHNDPDRSEDFLNFENANSENSALCAQPKTDFESMIYSCTDEAIEKCDLKPDNSAECANTPVKAIAPVEIDSRRREIENFVISKRGLEFSNAERRKGYFDKFSVDDWDNWEFQMKPKASAPIDRRDPVAEDPWRVENAIASMVKCRDFDAAEDRLSIIEKTNPVLANQLREKYLGGVA